ncbi:MAG: hypothetical protein LBN22_07105 [Clostridiales Family XIII bacterium]|jgi:mannose-6-phosphate isomerase|nr:hypothetical protein [Clostridiales Family XIII bacterium]
MEPVFFVPNVQEKVWGGEKLAEDFDKTIPGLRIGESFELSILPQSKSYVRSGEYSGMMLDELYKIRRDLFGTTSSEFPFNIKLTDAKGVMPVVIHDQLAERHRPIEGLYVIEAGPNAQFVVGTTIQNSLEYINVMKSGTMENHLKLVPAKTGDAYIVRSGIAHSFRNGALGYVIGAYHKHNTKIYDPNKDNIDLESVLETIIFDGEIEKQHPEKKDAHCSRVIHTSEFTVEIIDAEDAPYTDCILAHFAAYTALESGQILYEGKTKRYRKGDTFIMPAEYGEFTLAGGKLIKAYVS